ncbi:hypothetical protein GCM10010517_12840 [Streptosporangium fragile]|uniref:Uncharacterized protein n=1 Tax=Streptosporangium fragile TaxID=46186 RepID=A0ABN3VRX3_9ACTN
MVPPTVGVLLDCIESATDRSDADRVRRGPPCPAHPFPARKSCLTCVDTLRGRVRGDPMSRDVRPRSEHPDTSANVLCMLRGLLLSCRDEGL